MEEITFANFDYIVDAYDSSMFDLQEVIDVINEEYFHIMMKVNNLKNDVIDEETMKYFDDRGAGATQRSCRSPTRSGDIVKPDDLDGPYTKWDQICEQGYINDYEIEELTQILNNINKDIWFENYDKKYDPEISINYKLRDLKNIKEMMIYIKNHLRV